MSHQAVAPSKSQYLYVLVRQDIPPGLQLAQVGHATAEWALYHQRQAEQWMRDSNYIAVLGVADEAELLRWAEELPDDEIHLVFEPDIAGHTALVVSPGEHWRKLSELPCAGKEVVAA